MANESTYGKDYYARDELHPHNSAVPLTVLWLVIIAVILWAERSGILRHAWWWRVVSGAFWTVAALQTVHCLLKTTLAIRTFGLDLVPDLLRTTRLLPQSARAQYEALKIAVFSFLSAIGVALVVANRSNSILPLSVYFCSLLLVILIRNIFPPTAVYLATSTADRLTLLHHLQVRSIPNLVALLALSRTSQAPVSYRFISLFDFRTHDDATWRMVVDRLLAIAPVIIIDARDTSAGVIAEVDLLIRRGYLPKTVFISEPDGRLPVLQSLAVPHNTTDIKPLTENELLKTVRSITWRARKGRPLLVHPAKVPTT